MKLIKLIYILQISLVKLKINEYLMTPNKYTLNIWACFLFSNLKYYKRQMMR